MVEEGCDLVAMAKEMEEERKRIKKQDKFKKRDKNVPEATTKTTLRRRTTQLINN